MASEGVDTPEASRSIRDVVPRLAERIAARWLLVGVVALTALYHWLQSLQREAPWIFPDEARYAEFARAAADGSLEVAGESRRVGALQGILLAPAWLVDDPGTAWALNKLISVVAFCLTAVPVYLLAKRFVSSRTAVLAALASTLLPIAFYASTMMQEPLALPIAATVALLAVQLIEQFTWMRVGLLVLVCLAGAGVRGQMTVLPLAAAGAFLVDALTNAIRRRPVEPRTALTGVGFVGFGVLAFREGYGLDLLDAGWSVASDRPGDTLDTVLHSLGAAIVGVGVIPAVALVAALGLLGSTDRSRAAFAATAAGFAVVFTAYTGLKSASLQFIPVSLVEERNLIYVEPLAIVAVTAVATAIRWRGLVVAGCTTIALLVILPITRVGSSLILSENPGLSWVWHIRERADSGLEAPLTVALVALAVAGGAMLGRRRLVPPVLVVTSMLCLAAGALAYRGDHMFSRALAAEWLQPDRQWVDSATGGRPTALLTSGNLSDPVGIFMLLFWNRSIGPQVVVPGAPALSNAGVPIFPGEDGLFSAGDVEFALHTQNVRPDGETMPPAPGARYALTRLRTPTGLRSAIEGIEPDRWVRDVLNVRRFSDGQAGDLSVEVSTMNPLSGKPRVVTATVGERTTTWTIAPETVRTLRLAVPAGPFAVAFTMRPAEQPGPSDPRLLSLQIGRIAFPDDDVPRR